VNKLKETSVKKKFFSFKREKKTRITRSLVGNFYSLLLLAILCVFMALPLVYVINNAFKPLDELFIYPPRFFVRYPTLHNFRDLFILMAASWVPFTRYIFNSVFVTAIGTIGHVIISSLAAYALAKHNFKGKNLIFSIVVLSLMFSPVVTAVPNYILMAKLNFLDTYAAMVIPAFQASLGLYLMKQFMETVPDSIIESARIDGAKELKLFWIVVMPSVKPAWLTLVILSIQFLWNSVSIFTYSENLKTLPLALSQVLAGGIARAGAASAVALLMISVPIVAFITSQTKIIETMSTSGLKE